MTRNSNGVLVRRDDRTFLYSVTASFSQVHCEHCYLTLFYRAPLQAKSIWARNSNKRRHFFQFRQTVAQPEPPPFPSPSHLIHGDWHLRQGCTNAVFSIVCSQRWRSHFSWKKKKVIQKKGGNSTEKDGWLPASEHSGADGLSRHCLSVSWFSRRLNVNRGTAALLNID